MCTFIVDGKRLTDGERLRWHADLEHQAESLEQIEASAKQPKRVVSRDAVKGCAAMESEAVPA